MNESGKLADLLAKVPKIPQGGSECGQCGGHGFYPCTWCGGDKTSVSTRFGSSRQVVKLK